MNQRLAAYLEQRILSADPVELIRILYQSAVTEVREARRHLAASDILARSKAISKAFDIVTELSRSLDMSLDMNQGGEIAEGLNKLYDYIMRQLLDANFRQADEPLVEVLGLLTTLGEAWEGMSAPPVRGPVAVKPWTQDVNQGNAEYAGQGWSL